jgi:hypothetical protein
VTTSNKFTTELQKIGIFVIILKERCLVLSKLFSKLKPSAEAINITIYTNDSRKEMVITIRDIHLKQGSLRIWQSSVRQNNKEAPPQATNGLRIFVFDTKFDLYILCC